MVKGLEIFRDFFRDHADQYILIGGTACDIALQTAGYSFRATKDLDIVLCIEVLNKEFVKVFWDFIKQGGYKIQQHSSDKRQYYRFQKPDNSAFPKMLELFSRTPNMLTLPEGSHLTPIPTDDEFSSLSAILMDEAYYSFIRSGKRLSDGLSYIGPERLIPLKALAWLDLTERKTRGETVDSSSIKKHKNDVFRLAEIVDPEFNEVIPQVIKADLTRFFDQMKTENTDLTSLGVAMTLDEIFKLVKKIYGL